ncbi:energy-coupling factor ABC transporter ATP-binding protein [Enterococcus sp. HY326]|uniref:energy-coupling factor ABC transporter ATP-binding protein n=1 Tax=Enterococcus sp. HY326 TaxID=2971265 RepID=UPI00224046C9|nr:energy-coupling factor ABC transporter ATP-binding protein [Enterococcus sp. HY326]
MLIEISNLVHQYASGQRALNGVSFSIEATNPVAIIGQNGAGKTTLVKHLNGLLKPTSGKIYIDGKEISTQETSAWSKTVGYVFQNPDNQLFLDSVKKEFEFGPKQIGMEKEEIATRLEMVSQLVGLSKKLDVHPFDLSAAEKKFCTIGSVLMMNPKIIILDEPTCGQDLLGAQRLNQIVKQLAELNILCITISHDMRFVAENFERILVMRKGEVVLDGDRQTIFKEREQLASSFVTPPPIAQLGLKLGLTQLAFNAVDFINKLEEETQNV